jgi:hypothetical protein
MKKSIVFIVFILMPAILLAQPTMDLGVKAGVNNSKVTFRKSEFTSESIVKTHIGAFARFGWGRIYLQPEAYFGSKGGEILEPAVSTTDRAARFDFNNVDIPLLLGFKVVEGERSNIRLMAGPVFSFLTSKDVYNHGQFTRQYLEDNYYGFQYGVGIDLWYFFFDARMEHGANNLYQQPELGVNGKNQTFMVTVGFKIL